MVAFIALACSMNSAFTGLLLCLRFRTMKIYEAFHCARQSLRICESILWNTCVTISIPIVWLAWRSTKPLRQAQSDMALRSALSCVVLFLFFSWSTDTTPIGDDRSSNTPRQVLPSARLAIGIPLILGAISFIALLITLSSYKASMSQSSVMDESSVMQDIRRRAEGRRRGLRSCECSHDGLRAACDWCCRDDQPYKLVDV
jgi:hypothetical protein